ncbi:MAG: hypothetical protein EXR62_16595 [Chloroflexi bacterium]|nr:hypothetical protein [Chloroflexota bacterium]
MKIPPQYQNAQYHLNQLLEVMKLHEEWLRNWPNEIPYSAMRTIADDIINLAQRQMHQAQENAFRFTELYSRSQESAGSQSWEEMRARLQEYSQVSYDLLLLSARLRDLVSYFCDQE